MSSMRGSLVAAFFFLVPGMALLIHEALPLYSWPSSEGEVTEAMVIPHSPPRCMILVSMKYRNGPNQFLGATTLGTLGRFDMTECTELSVGKFAAGTKHPILFNPKEPTLLIAREMAGERVWPGLIALAGGAFVGAALMTLVRKGRSSIRGA